MQSAFARGWRRTATGHADGKLRAPGLRRQVALALAGAAVSIVLVLALYAASALDLLELKTVDTRFTLRGPTHAPNELVVVGIDSRTFAALGLQWPFPRSLAARVIDQLKRDGARVIVYDEQFTERTTPSDSSEATKQAAIEQDNALILAVHRAGNVVLATTEVGPHGEQYIFGGGGILDRIGARAGSGIFPVDSDGVDRRMLYDFRGLRSLGIVATELADGHRIAPSALGGSGAWIDFAGPPGTILKVPFASVLRGEAPASMFVGKTVVVGATVSNLQDVHETPVGGSQLMSGPELVAESIATATRGFPLQPSGDALTVLLIVAFGLVAPLAGLRYSPGWAIVLALAVASAYAVSTQLAFDAGTILPVAYPLTALALGCGGAVAADSFGERRQLRALEDALGKLPGERSHFFISYRRGQSQWPARILHDELVARFGAASVFMDKAAIDAGQIWPARIEQAIAECSVMLVLIGPDWLAARGPGGSRRLDDPEDWVRREVLAGLGNEHAVVVPVLLDGAAMPDAQVLPDPLRPLSHCNAIPLAGDDPRAEIDQLVDSIQKGMIRDRLR
jgi:CHASE2 domain-containing sensor protein